MNICTVCFRHCRLEDGQTGWCRARSSRNGTVVPDNYGILTAVALDPIEKKPLARFYPGSKILSVGSYGCNLGCPFCQNASISMANGSVCPTRKMSPEKLCEMAEQLVPDGNIGTAFTYNEPLIGYEYVRDTAKQVRDAGLKNVLVTNGTVSLSVLRELEPYIHAMNIDLKGFREDYYRTVLHGNLPMTKAFIAEAVNFAHVEITTLIVPGENDSEEEMRDISAWIASLRGGTGYDIPFHISRFFPRYHRADRTVGSVSQIYALADVARERLQYVYTGNC